MVEQFANGKQTVHALQSSASKFSSKMKIIQKFSKTSKSTNSSKRCQTGKLLRISFLSSLSWQTSSIRTRQTMKANLRRAEASRSGRKSPVWRMNCWKSRKKFYKRKLLLEEKYNFSASFVLNKFQYFIRNLRQNHRWFVRSGNLKSLLCMFAAQISASLIECLKQQKYCKAQIFQFIYQIESILQIVDKKKKKLKSSIFSFSLLISRFSSSLSKI